MLKITITSVEVDVIKYTDKRGQPAQLRKQTGYLHGYEPSGQPLPFPDKFSFLLDSDAAPFPAGTYDLHPSAVFVDREGRLACAPRLTPAKPATPRG